VDIRQDSTTAQAIRPLWIPAFLAALRETGIVRDACEAANIDRTTPYVTRKHDPAFAEAWDAAILDASDLLIREATRRARVGVREPVIYQGKLQGVWVNEDGDVVTAETPNARLVPLSVTKYSDPLLMFLIKGIRPEYNASHHTTDVKVSGDPSRPVRVEHDHEHSGTVGVVTPASAAVLEFLRDLGLPCPEPVRADGGEEPVDRGDGPHPAPEAAEVPPPRGDA